MMLAIAFLALLLTVVVQSVRLRQSLIREQQLRAEADLQRARAEAERDKARAAVDAMYTAIEEQQLKRPVVPTGP